MVGLPTPGAPNIQLVANQVHAFQIIGNGVAPNARTNNNLLYFTEDVASSATDAVCTATITPRFYQSGADLATEMGLRMNAATCTGRQGQHLYRDLRRGQRHLHLHPRHGCAQFPNGLGHRHQLDSRRAG